MVHPGLELVTHPSGPPASGTATALITIAAVITALAPVLIYVWKSRGCPAPRLPDKTRRRYRRDMKHVRRRDPGGRAACASCGGRSTRLRKQNGQWICRNRNLCRAALIYASMLDGV